MRSFKLVYLSWFFALISCASYTDDTKEMRDSYQFGSYKKAFEKLESSDIKDQERNRLIYLLEKSMILDRLNRKDQSRKTLIEADKVADQMYRASIGGKALSFIYNDSASDYQGEDYEKVAIHTMLALSFLEAGNLGSARVSARAINTTLTEINNFYKDNKNRYRDDAFAHYIAGAIYEAKAEIDSAIIEYRAALKTYESDYSDHFETAVPDGVVASLYKLAKTRKRHTITRDLKKRYPSVVKKISGRSNATLYVIHELDSITYKTTSDFVFVWDGKPIRFSFPVIKNRSWRSYGRTGVSINGRYHSGELAQNMDTIASETLEDSRGRYTAKMMARIVLKDQISQQAKKNFGLVGALAAGIYGAVSETADTRSWTLLPAAFYVTRVEVAPGKKTVKVITNDRASAFKTLDFRAGQVYFIRDHG